MARGDFKDMQDRVIARGYGEPDRTEIKSWINDAHADVVSRHPWSFGATTTTVATVAGTRTSQPSAANAMYESQQIYRLAPTTAGLIEPRYVDWSEFYGNPFRTDLASTTRGVPTTFSIYGLQIFWDPIPDAVYNYNLYYTQGINDTLKLVNDTDVPLVPSMHTESIVLGALMRGAERDRNLAMAQWWSGLYEQMIAQMWWSEENRRHPDQGPTQVGMSWTPGNSTFRRF